MDQPDWEVIGKQGTAIWEGDKIIAQMNEPRKGARLAHKNAVLMAASKRMLKELEDILDWALTEKAPLRAQEIESIRSVIARARDA